MPTPDFVLELRDKIGHDLLPMIGVLVVVVDQDRILLVRRRDNGLWTPIGGIVEPGEQPAVTAAREVAEETGVRIRIDRLVDVVGEPERSYPNGDRVQFTSFGFRARPIDGTAADARVNDDESVEVGWFGLDALPPVRDDLLERIRRSIPPRGDVWFVRPD